MSRRRWDRDLAWDLLHVLIGIGGIVMMTIGVIADRPITVLVGMFGWLLLRFRIIDQRVESLRDTKEDSDER